MGFCHLPARVLHESLAGDPTCFCHEKPLGLSRVTCGSEAAIATATIITVPAPEAAATLGKARGSPRAAEGTQLARTPSGRALQPWVTAGICGLMPASVPLLGCSPTAGVFQAERPQLPLSLLMWARGPRLGRFQAHCCGESMVSYYFSPSYSTQDHSRRRIPSSQHGRISPKIHCLATPLMLSLPSNERGGNWFHLQTTLPLIKVFKRNCLPADSPHFSCFPPPPWVSGRDLQEQL